MREKPNAHSGIVAVVGLAMALAVYLGLSQIAKGLSTIPTSLSSSCPNPSPTAFAVPPNHFVVVHEYGIETYTVDVSGHIQKMDQYDPNFPKTGQINAAEKTRIDIKTQRLNSGLRTS